MTKNETNELCKLMFTDFDQLPLAMCVEDIMSVLGISRNTAYSLVRSGKLHSVRAGRKIIIPKDALQSFFEES